MGLCMWKTKKEKHVGHQKTCHTSWEVICFLSLSGRPNDSMIQSTCQNSLHLGVHTCCQRLGRISAHPDCSSTHSHSWSLETSWCTDHLLGMHLDHAPDPMTAARHCRVIFEPQNAGNAVAWAWLDRESGFLKCPFIIEDMWEHLPEHTCTGKSAKFLGVFKIWELPRSTRMVNSTSVSRKITGLDIHDMHFCAQKTLEWLNSAWISFCSRTLSALRQAAQENIISKSPWVSIVSYGPMTTGWFKGYRHDLGNLHIRLYRFMVVTVYLVKSFSPRTSIYIYRICVLDLMVRPLNIEW